MKKRLLWLTALLLLAAATLPYWTTGFARQALINALESSLSRPVRIQGQTRLQLLPRPAVLATDVIIRDDPAYSLEPFAYVALLEVQPSLRALLTGRLAARRLRLTEPSVNLMRTASGWNIQTLLPAGLTPPEIEVRQGRLNLKQGDFKSPFFLRNALVDLSAPTPQGDIKLFVSAEPARTDRAAQGFGAFSLRGFIHLPPSGPPQLDFECELAPSALHAFNFFFGARGVDFAGRFSGQATIRGPWDDAAVSLSFRFDGLDPQGLLPFTSRGNLLQLTGRLDWPGQRFALDTAPRENFRARFRLRDFLQSPHGALLLALRDLPLPRLLDLGREAGARIPPGVTAEGLLHGVISYSWPSPREIPAHGMVWSAGARLAIPGEPLLELPAASVVVDGSVWRMAPAEVRLGPSQNAALQAEWNSLSGALSFELATQLLNIRSLKTGLGLLVRASSLPLLANAQGGNWQGNLRFSRASEEDPGAWSGRFLIRNSAISLDGLPAPLNLSTASILFDRQRVSVQRLRADYAGATLEGAAHWSTLPGRPLELDLTLPEASPALLQQLLAPALRPPGSLLDKLRSARPNPPAWLARRLLTGRLNIQSFPLAGGALEPLTLDLNWRGPLFSAQLDQTRFVHRQHPAPLAISGELTATLWEPALLFQFTGKLAGWPSEPTPVDLSGVFRANPLQPRWLDTLEGEAELSRPAGARLLVRAGRPTLEFPESRRRPPIPLTAPYWPLTLPLEP